MNNIKNYIYILLLSIPLTFTQCTKKAGEKMVKEEITEVMESAKTFRSMVPKAGPARNIEIGDYASFDLDNGLKVIVVENHKLPIVSYQVSLLNDPVIEGDKAGYISMAGGLLTTGTQTRSKSDIDEKVDFYGATLNSSSSGVFMSSLKKHSGQLMNIFTDVLFNASFPKEEFEKAKTQTLSGLASQKTDANSISSNVRSKLIYGENHPYGEVESEKTIGNITLEDCKSYYNSYFKPNNAYLIIVGDVTVDEAKATANKHFSSWEAGDVPTQSYDSPMPPKETKVAFANKDGAVQSVISVTYPIDLKPTSPDVLKATAMNQILGGGVFSGRLMQNLREDKAFTYGARSRLSSDPIAGSFSAGASVRNEVTDSSVHEFMYELRRMNTEPVALEDLQLIKNSMAGSFARSLESPQTIARFARNTFKYNLPKDYYNTYLSRLETITPADITAMSKKYIKPDNAYIVVVGNKDEVAEKLIPYDSDGKIDYYGAYGEEVNYGAALPAGTTAETVLADYISSIGGREKLEAVKTLVTNGGLNLMGQQATLLIKVKTPNKMINSMTMGGQVMQEQKFDGEKGSISGMGQSKTITKDDPEFAQLQSETTLFEQLTYGTEDNKVELKGIEDFEGEQCYKLKVMKGDLEETQFYSIKTSLLVGNVVAKAEGEAQQVITTKFGDYMTVDGILLPHAITILGAAPFPLEMKISSYEVNADIPDSEFSVD